jgi:prepilin-type N-terminal cleavage/methylation domain-containing protein
MNRGFTVVELIITLSVIVILLTLGVVGFRSAQANARDSERQSDINTIARGLERRYNEDNPVVTSSTYSDPQQGRYPSILEMRHALGDAVSAFTPSDVDPYVAQLLPGVSQAALQHLHRRWL